MTRRQEQLELAGETVLMKQLTDGQHIKLDHWAQARMIDAARRSVPDDLVDTPMWDRVVGVAIKESVTCTWSRSGAMKSRQGYAYMMSVACDVSEAKMLQLLSDATKSEIRALNEAFMRLNYSPKETASANPPEPGSPGMKPTE
jgi:hypothetical protein